jgi:hypothetical protein
MARARRPNAEWISFDFTPGFGSQLNISVVPSEESCGRRALNLGTECKCMLLRANIPSLGTGDPQCKPWR